MCAFLYVTHRTSSRECAQFLKRCAFGHAITLVGVGWRWFGSVGNSSTIRFEVGHGIQVHAVPRPRGFHRVGLSAESGWIQPSEARTTHRSSWSICTTDVRELGNGGVTRCTTTRYSLNKCRRWCGAHGGRKFRCRKPRSTRWSDCPMVQLL